MSVSITRIATDLDEALIEAYHLTKEMDISHAIIILIDSEGVPDIESTLDYQDTLAVLNSLV